MPSAPRKALSLRRHPCVRGAAAPSRTNLRLQTSPILLTLGGSEELPHGNRLFPRWINPPGTSHAPAPKTLRFKRGVTSRMIANFQASGLRHLVLTPSIGSSSFYTCEPITRGVDQGSVLVGPFTVQRGAGHCPRVEKGSRNVVWTPTLTLQVRFLDLLAAQQRRIRNGFPSQRPNAQLDRRGLL